MSSVGRAFMGTASFLTSVRGSAADSSADGSNKVEHARELPVQAVLEKLGEHPTATVGQVADQLGISEGLIQKALSKLESLDLVTCSASDATPTYKLSEIGERALKYARIALSS